MDPQELVSQVLCKVVASTISTSKFVVQSWSVGGTQPHNGSVGNHVLSHRILLALDAGGNATESSFLQSLGQG